MKITKKQTTVTVLILGIFILSLLAVFLNPTKEIPYQYNEGAVFGTVYHVTYRHEKDLHSLIEQELHRFDNSLSPFNPRSTITRINQGEISSTNDTLFIQVFRKAMEIAEKTNGAFDITVAPLVNAWGFGFKKQIPLTHSAVDSLLRFVGYQKIQMDAHGNIRKEDPRVQLDCSAIAKGYASDVIGMLLEKEGISDYLVEIGGEIICKGKSPKAVAWKVGINKPEEDSLSINQDIQQIVSLSGKGMATSGNYRRFYYKDGKKYAHTIDPKSGYPIEHTLLSTTVIADNCMTADAYATAFMVLGTEEALRIVSADPSLSVYLIEAAAEEKYNIITSPSFEKSTIKP